MAGSDQWKTAAPSDTNLRGKWWEIFGDPQLNSFEEKIAYFPAQRVVIGAVDRVEHLVRLLEDEAPQ